jgi:hypothetical protein
VATRELLIQEIRFIHLVYPISLSYTIFNNKKMAIYKTFDFFTRVKSSSELLCYPAPVWRDATFISMTLYFILHAIKTENHFINFDKIVVISYTRGKVKGGSDGKESKEHRIGIGALFVVKTRGAAGKKKGGDK